VTGTDNHLADIISRNPAGLNASEIRNFTTANTIVVNKIDLNIDKTVYKDLGNLAQLQQTDPRIQTIRQRRDSHPTATDGRYRLWDNTVFCRELRNASER
jgi:long-subunit fatty acid transport protein